MITHSEWQDIDTVLLDMDGTLLDLHFDNYFWVQHLPRRYAEANGLSEQQALDYLLPIFQSERGKLQWYCLDFWQEKTGLDIVGLKHEVAHLIAVRPHSLEFLQALRRLGKQAFLVTNAHSKSLEIKMARTGLAAHLDRIYSSHDFGAAKEHAEFWPRFQQATGIAPERSLFIDDTESVLDAASHYGIRHVLAVQQPDSKRQREPLSTHKGIHHFSEIMPV